jgi:hypothetical protein
LPCLTLPCLTLLASGVSGTGLYESDEVVRSARELNFMQKQKDQRRAGSDDGKDEDQPAGDHRRRK